MKIHAFRTALAATLGYELGKAIAGAIGVAIMLAITFALVAITQNAKPAPEAGIELPATLHPSNR